MMKKGLAILLIVTMLMTFSAGTAMAGEPEGAAAEGSLAVWEDEKGEYVPVTTWDLPVAVDSSWVNIYLGTKEGDTFSPATDITSYTLRMKKDTWKEEEAQEVDWDSQDEGFPGVGSDGFRCILEDEYGNKTWKLNVSLDSDILTPQEGNVKDVNGDYTISVEWTKDAQRYNATVVISVKKIETSLNRVYQDSEHTWTDESIKVVAKDEFKLPYAPYLDYSDQEAGDYLMVDEELGLMDFVGCDVNDGVFKAGTEIAYPLGWESDTKVTAVSIDYSKLALEDEKTYHLTFRGKQTSAEEKVYSVTFAKSIPTEWEKEKLYAVKSYNIEKGNDGKLYFSHFDDSVTDLLLDKVVVKMYGGNNYYFVTVGEDGTLTPETMAEVSDATIHLYLTTDEMDMPIENCYFVSGVSMWDNGKIYTASGDKSIGYDVLLPRVGVYRSKEEPKQSYIDYDIYCSKLEKNASGNYCAYILQDNEYRRDETLSVKLSEVEFDGNVEKEKKAEGITFTQEDDIFLNDITYRVWKMTIDQSFTSEDEGRYFRLRIVSQDVDGSEKEWDSVDFYIYGETVVAPAQLEKLQITTPPTKTAYIEGQDFDPAGMEVTAVYDNGTSFVLEDEEYSIIGGKNLEAGTTSVAIKVGKATVQQSITVAPKEIANITITEPTKKEYTVGEEANWSGLVVTAKFNDESERVLNQGEYSITGFDSSAEADQQTITVTAGDQTATFNIKIKKAASPSYPSGGGGGGFIPVAQPVKVTTQSGENGKITLNPVAPKVGDKVVITITPEEGYVVEDVLVDGKSVGAVTTYTVDKASANLNVSATFKKTEDTSEALIAQIKDAQLVAQSKMVKVKGKKAVKVFWHVEGDTDLTFDGYDVFRSVKRYSGFGKKPIFSTSKAQYYNTAVKVGTKYYYKVRAYKLVDGEKVYTDWSTKAWRTVK